MAQTTIDTELAGFSERPSIMRPHDRNTHAKAASCPMSQKSTVNAGATIGDR